MSQRAEQAEISPESARFGAYREGVRDRALKVTRGARAAVVKDCTTGPFCLIWNYGIRSDRPPRSIDGLNGPNLDRVALPGG